MAYQKPASEAITINRGELRRVLKEWTEENSDADDQVDEVLELLASEVTADFIFDKLIENKAG